MLFNLIYNGRILLVGSLLLLCASTSAVAADKRMFEAEAAKRIGGASKVTDRGASGGHLVGLSKPGQGIKFTRLPAASKLAIRYASVKRGHDQRRGQRPTGPQSEHSFIGGADQFISQCDH